MRSTRLTPPPPQKRPSIQNSANLLSHNLQSLHATLSSAQPALTSAHTYPLPSYPGRTQEDLLGQLLRKKIQPPVEDWIEIGVGDVGIFAEDGVVTTNGAGVNGVVREEKEEERGKAQGGGLFMSGREVAELWDWAGPEENRIAREIGEDGAFDDEFTLVEREDGIENVVTGLRRKFWESDEEEEDEKGENGGGGGGAAKKGGDKMDVDAVVQDAGPEIVKGMRRAGVDDSRPLMPLEAILRFTNSGIVPGLGTGGGQMRR